jgi:hypothetical protein
VPYGESQLDRQHVRIQPDLPLSATDQARSRRGMFVGHAHWTAVALSSAVRFASLMFSKTAAIVLLRSLYSFDEHPRSAQRPLTWSWWPMWTDAPVADWDVPTSCVKLHCVSVRTSAYAVANNSWTAMRLCCYPSRPALTWNRRTAGLPDEVLFRDFGATRCIPG